MTFEPTFQLVPGNKYRWLVNFDSKNNSPEKLKTSNNLGRKKISEKGLCLKYYS
jgi:hypothetical protein